MRILIIIFLFTLNANATVYYVSNTGSDAADGLTTGTAWQTIAKVNATITDGDIVNFKKGDSWSERLNVPGSNITFSSYGTGAKPVISGLALVTGFTNVGNVWTALVPLSVPKLNTVIINGTLKAKARTPNTGYLTFSSVNSHTQITTSLTGTPDYSGHEIVVRQARWIIDVTKVSSQSGGVLNFVEPLTYNASYDGNGFFFQNHVDDLDVSGEWVFDSTAKTLKVYANTEPTVYISTIDTIVHVRGDNNTFDGLDFRGANRAAFQLDTANHTTIENSSINYSGADAISGKKSNGTSVLNDSIQNSLSGAIFLTPFDVVSPIDNDCDSSIIYGNYIKNTGVYAGMGLSNNGRYIAVYNVGHGGVIQNNIVDSSGYIPIIFNGKNTLVYKNHVRNFCYVKDDGGGIYAGIGGYFPADYNDGGVVRRNITESGFTANAGTPGTGYSFGIYLDDYARYITIDSNTSYKIMGANYFYHNVSNITSRGNTAVNDGSGSNLWVNGGFASGTINQNINYLSSSTYTHTDVYGGGSFSALDSNYYSRPTNENNSFKLNSATYALAGWKTATGQDANSRGTPSGITTDTPLFYYNPTHSDSVISLSGQYKDARGNVYTDSITLIPFTSAVLYKVAAPVTLRVRFRKVQNI